MTVSTDPLPLDAWHRCAAIDCVIEVPIAYTVCPAHSPIRGADWPYRYSAAEDVEA